MSCYFPGPQLAQGFGYCVPYTQTTLCCPWGWSCLNTHLCRLDDSSLATNGMPVGTTIRGACTDPSWNNTICGDFCLNEPASDNTGRVVYCGNNKWCCGAEYEAGTCSCESGQGTFTAQHGEQAAVVSVGPIGGISTVFNAPPPTPFPSKALSLHSIHSTTSSLSSTSTTSAASPLSLSQQAPSSSPAPTKSSSLGQTQAASSDNNVIHSTGFKVGVGIAAALAGLFVVCLLIWLLCWPFRRRGPRSDGAAAPLEDSLTEDHRPLPPDTSMRNPYIYRPDNNRSRYSEPENDPLRSSPVFIPRRPVANPTSPSSRTTPHSPPPQPPPQSSFRNLSHNGFAPPRHGGMAAGISTFSDLRPPHAPFMRDKPRAYEPGNPYADNSTFSQRFRPIPE